MRYYTVDIALYGDALEGQMPAGWGMWRVVTGIEPPHMPDEMCLARIKYSADEDGFCVDSVQLWIGGIPIYENQSEIAAECQQFLNDRPDWVWKFGSFCQ